MADYTAPEPYGRSFTSISGATAVTVGSAREVTGARCYALDVRSTGASLTVALEGTVDGTNWSEIGSVTAAGLTWYVDKPVVQVRANLNTVDAVTPGVTDVTVLAV